LSEEKTVLDAISMNGAQNLPIFALIASKRRFSWGYPPFVVIFPVTGTAFAASLAL